MNKIKIITTAIAPVQEVIRGGGEEQSLVTSAAKKITQSLEVSSEFISEQIFNTISVVNSAIDKLYDASKQFSADEITLSLAVSAEGNIGLVSAGAEATIEIKFKRVDKVSSS